MRKHTPVVLLLFFALLGCTKEQIEPDLSAAVKGNYEVYYIQDGTDKLNLPMPDFSVGIQIVPITKNTANLFVNINFFGDKQTESIEIDLKGTPEIVEFYEKGEATQSGTIKGGMIEFNYVSDDGIRTIMRAKK